MNAPLPPIVLRDLLEGSLSDVRGSFVPLCEGVEILPLYGPDTGDSKAVSDEPSAALIRYQPGAQVRRHLHRGYEHIIVLSGEQSDERGSYGKGTCVINPPGTSHQVRSEQGCLVLVIWDHPVEFGVAGATEEES